MRIYISGPMSGRPDWNFPEFAAAASHLRALGHEVASPHEMHSTEADTERPWPVPMRCALSDMLTCDAIYMLLGWADSSGAKIEWRLAHDLDFTVFYQPLEETHHALEEIPC